MNAIPLPETLPVPLYKEEDGAYRIGNSRVLLEIVVSAFLQGDSAETIARNYDTLDLPDIYAVLAHFLKNRKEVELYIARREREADEVRLELESEYPKMVEFREELKRRIAARKSS